MSKINGTIALALSAAAVLVIALVGWFVLVSPQRSKASDLDTQIQAANAELASDQQLLAAPNKKQTEKTLRAAERALPDEPRVSEILRQLSALADKSRTELDGITPGAPVAAAGAEAVPIALTFQGRYFALQKLLRLVRASADLQNGHIVGSGRLYSVDGITFANGGTTPGQAGLVTATIALNAFVYTTPPVVATAPTDTTASNVSP
jgi:Pilus assembly protein, PilO